MKRLAGFTTIAMAMVSQIHFVGAEVKPRSIIRPGNPIEGEKKVSQTPRIQASIQASG